MLTNQILIWMFCSETLIEVNEGNIINCIVDRDTMLQD